MADFKATGVVKYASFSSGSLITASKASASVCPSRTFFIASFLNFCSYAKTIDHSGLIFCCAASPDADGIWMPNTLSPRMYSVNLLNGSSVNPCSQCFALYLEAMHNHEYASTFMTFLYSSVEFGIFALAFVLVTRIWPVLSTAD